MAIRTTPSRRCDCIAPGRGLRYGTVVSEYYARGRAVFADAASLAFFMLGFLGAGPLAWPALRAAFENGQYDRGLAIFVGRLFGSGLVAGLLGFVLGALAGRLWQAWHRWRRARRQGAASAEQHARRAGLATPDAAARTPDGATPGDARRAPPAMSCRVGPLTPNTYAAFARRRATSADDRRYVESATTEILTLAAWDGLEVAGVARLLSDGHGALFIMDFAVDPHYVESVVEEALIDCALRRVPPGGRLTRV